MTSSPAPTGSPAIHLPPAHPDRLQFVRRELRDPETGRRMQQITQGESHCYPLYYFIPTMSSDGKTLLFHRWAENDIQMYALEMATGEARRLTWGKTPGFAQWPGGHAPSSGVRDQLSAYNDVKRELVYFSSQEIRAVHVDTLEDRLVTVIPEDRWPSGQSGVSPDGKYLVYGQMDRAYMEADWATRPSREKAKGALLVLVDLETGSSRNLVCMNTWITHANFIGPNRIIFCHPPTENGIMVTDTRGGWYAHIRTQDGPNLPGPLPIEQTSHYHATEMGIAYEMRTRLGLCDPHTYECQEYLIGDYPVTHIGRDPQGLKWFFDSKRPHLQSGDHTGPRCILYMPELRHGQANKPQLIMSGSVTYGEGQHSHLHPVLTPDRGDILHVVGDDRTMTNHMCLLVTRMPLMSSNHS